MRRLFFVFLAVSCIGCGAARGKVRAASSPSEPLYRQVLVKISGAWVQFSICPTGNIGADLLFSLPEGAVRNGIFARRWRPSEERFDGFVVGTEASYCTFEVRAADGQCYLIAKDADGKNLLAVRQEKGCLNGLLAQCSLGEIMIEDPCKKRGGCGTIGELPLSSSPAPLP